MTLGSMTSSGPEEHGIVRHKVPIASPSADITRPPGAGPDRRRRRGRGRRPGTATIVGAGDGHPRADSSDSTGAVGSGSRLS